MNGRAEWEPGRIALEGNLLQTRLKVSDGHFAMGLSTDEPVRFQGFHAENLLVVLDEACGVPEEIWDAVEGICVGTNNRVLAISNPLTPAGRFHSLFRQKRWETFTISALQHPNVLGMEPHIPGAITREAVKDRIASWCQPSDADDPEAFVWNEQHFRPETQFLIRVLGEFPNSAEDSLCSVSAVAQAMERELTPGLPCILAVDIARYGSDETVFALRRGDTVLPLKVFRNQPLTETARQIQMFAQRERADAVLIDAVGMGAGVEDMLRETALANVVAVQAGGKPFGTKGMQFLNVRAQMFFTLRDKLEAGEIALPNDDVLRAQLAALRYHHAPCGKIVMQSKEEMRKAGISSPDRADAVAMLFCPQAELTEICRAIPVTLETTFEQRIAPVSWGGVYW